MRIAVLTEVFLPKIDGITNRLRNTLECLRDLGHEVLVLAPDRAQEEWAGASVLRIPSAPFPPYPTLRAALPLPRIATALARFKPDVVHAVGPACLGVWGTIAARALGLPLVASYHTDFARYAPRYGLAWTKLGLWPALRLVHNAALITLCPSRFTAEELRAHGIADVGLWRGGVDSALFHPRRRSEAMRVRLAPSDPSAPLLLYAGRIAEEKGLDVLADVLAAVPGARLALVGDGPARPGLERRLDPRRVVFTGFLSGETLATAFASADVFVMPSTTETLGFVVLEAMSAGCAVVAARSGGIPDLVTHGQTGLLYDPNDRRAAARTVASLLFDSTLRDHLVRHARAAADAASWRAETEALVGQYQRAIEAHARLRPRGRLREAVLQLA